MRPRVVSFHTGGIYTEYAERLRRSCERFKWPHTIVDLGHGELKDRDWVEITNFKPRFILSLMRKIGQPLLWIDADGELLAEPALLEETYADFAIYAKERRRRRWRPAGREVEELPADWPDTRWFLSGTVFVNNTLKGLELLIEWDRLCRSDPRAYEQLQAQYAWCKVKPQTLFLPEDYCRVGGRGGVIRHDYASVREISGKRRQVVRA